MHTFQCLWDALKFLFQMPLTATLHYTFRVTTRQLVSNFAAACRHLGARYRHQRATPFQGSCGNCFVRSFTACTWVAGWLHVQEACAALASRLQRWRSQLVMLLWSITSWTSCTLLVRLLQLFIFLPLSLLFSLSLSHTHTHTHTQIKCSYRFTDCMLTHAHG